MQKKIMAPMQPPEAPPAITPTLLPPPDKRNQYVASLLYEWKRQAKNKQNYDYLPS